MLFIETSTFTKRLPRHLDDDSYAALQAFLSVHPEAGDVIRGTGGIRKIRWAATGRASPDAASEEARGSSATSWLPRTTSTC